MTRKKGMVYSDLQTHVSWEPSQRKGTRGGGEILAQEQRTGSLLLGGGDGGGLIRASEWDVICQGANATPARFSKTEMSSPSTWSIRTSSFWRRDTRWEQGESTQMRSPHCHGKRPAFFSHIPARMTPPHWPGGLTDHFNTGMSSSLGKWCYEVQFIVCYISLW